MIPGALDKDNAIKAASQCANNVGIITADAGDATGTKTVCSKMFCILAVKFHLIGIT